MFGCVLSQLKPSELYILSCGKGRANIFTFTILGIDFRRLIMTSKVDPRAVRVDSEELSSYMG